MTGSWTLRGLAVAGALAALAAGSTTGVEDGFSPWVDAEGAITLPEDFRARMVHLGSWFVPDGAAGGFHDVYTEPESVEAYRRTGKFPDGATLVKELRGSVAKDYTTGKGVSRANDELKQWFVMVKDSTGRFPQNPLWGNGWGWALYKGVDPATNVATDFRRDCLGCHVPASGTDWVFVEGYPTLK